MMKKTALLSVWVLLCTSLFAQYFENYEPVRSSGKLPADFTMAVSEAVEAAKNETSVKKSREDRQFIMGSAFSLNRVMLGGKVLFNDPMAEYVEKVLAELLKTNPKLREKIRVYMIKSPYVNAFATSEGALFINIGLLAQLENEAQLAYILAHEIVHVDKKHSLEEFKKSVDLSKGKGVYSDLNQSEKLLARAAYSKEKEVEADELGFLEYYTASNYSYNEIVGVFDILKYGHLPIDEVTFDLSFFENEGFRFPPSYTLSTISEIDTQDEEEDLEGSHPALSSRREMLEKMLQNRSDEGRKAFVISESEFKKARDIARFELCRLQVLEEDYTSAIYNAYILLREYPDNKYLLKLVGTSMYWMAHNNITIGKNTYKKVQGESQRLAFLLHKLSLKQKDMDMVSVAFAAKLKLLFPKDQEIELLLNENIKHAVSAHGINEKYLYSVYMNSNVADSSRVSEEKVVQEKVEETDKNEKKSKYQKIAQTKANKEAVLGEPSDSLNFHKYTLATYLDKLNIKDRFSKEYKLQEELDQDTKNSKSSSAKSRVLTRKYGEAVGKVSKVIVVDPYYFGISEGKDRKIKYLKNEREEKDMVNRIEDCAKAANISVDVIEPKLFNENDVEKYNDMVILDEWFSERIVSSKGFNARSETPVTSIGNSKIRELTSKYDTEYAMWTVSLFEERNRGRGRMIVGMVLMPPLIPILIHRAINGSSVSHFMAVAYNLETGELKLANSKTIWDNNYGYVKNSNIYFVFHQLSQVDKKNKKYN